MRPKKIILLADADEYRRSVTKFLLELRGYRLILAASASEALAAFRDATEIDLVICCDTGPKMDGGCLIELLKRMNDYVPMMLVVEGKTEGHALPWPDAFVNRYTISNQELLESIKVMVARKRGPRPHVSDHTSLVASPLAGVA